MNKKEREEEAQALAQKALANPYKITMLDKSGYVVTTEKAILVFDYYKDPEKALKKILDNHKHLPVIFFISSYGDNLSDHDDKKPKHDHHLPRYEREELDPNLDIPKHEGGHKRDEESHFNHDVFNLAQNHQRIYVMSDDIAAKAIRTDVTVAWIHKGDTLDRLPAGIQVKAYGTNERGVSFLVTLPNTETIFYAGEYTNWQMEPDMSLVKESFNKFIQSLHHVEDDVKSLTVMFFPVDPRIGDPCYQEARLFMQNVSVKYFIPMGFGEDYQQACDFDQYLTDQTTGIALHSPSQTVEVTPEGVKSVPD